MQESSKFTVLAKCRGSLSYCNTFVVTQLLGEIKWCEIYIGMPFSQGENKFRGRGGYLIPKLGGSYIGGNM